MVVAHLFLAEGMCNAHQRKPLAPIRVCVCVCMCVCTRMLLCKVPKLVTSGAFEHPAMLHKLSITSGEVVLEAPMGGREGSVCILRDWEPGPVDLHLSRTRCYSALG